MDVIEKDFVRHDIVQIISVHECTKEYCEMMHTDIDFIMVKAVCLVKVADTGVVYLHETMWEKYQWLQNQKQMFYYAPDVSEDESL